MTEQDIENRATPESTGFSEQAFGDFVTGMVQDDGWHGDTPYEIRLLDEASQKAYILEVRKGADWITVQKRASDNPMISFSYLLELKDGKWEYIDTRKLKRGESSMAELEEVFGLLKKSQMEPEPAPISTESGEETSAVGE